MKLATSNHDFSGTSKDKSFDDVAIFRLLMGIRSGTGRFLINIDEPGGASNGIQKMSGVKTSAGVYAVAASPFGCPISSLFVINGAKSRA